MKNQKERWDLIAYKYLKGKTPIIDIGCGVGRFISVDPKNIIGGERNKKTVAQLKKKKYQVKEADVTKKLPFKDASVGGVHCAHLIEHLYPEQLHDLFKEFDRVLMKGGNICIRTPLMHRGFYNDMTHIKPYNPSAVTHYLKSKDKAQTTAEEVQGRYKVVKLKYRREQLFAWAKGTWLHGVFRIASVIKDRGITSWRRNGYLLVLRKMK